MERKKADIPTGPQRITTPNITKLPDGTICVGDGCSILKIPPKGNIEMDFSECPEEVKKIIINRLTEGAGTEYVNRTIIGKKDEKHTNKA